MSDLIVHAVMYRDYKLGTICDSQAWGPPTLFTTIVEKVTCPGCRDKLDPGTSRPTVLTHYVDRHWQESPSRNGEDGVVMSVCGKTWKPSEDNVSEGDCLTCVAIVKSGWVK